MPWVSYDDFLLVYLEDSELMSGFEMFFSIMNIQIVTKQTHKSQTIQPNVLDSRYFITE